MKGLGIKDSTESLQVPIDPHKGSQGHPNITVAILKVKHCGTRNKSGVQEAID